MPLHQITLPVSIATRKRIVHDYGNTSVIVLKRKTWLYNMVSQVEIPTDATEEGVTFQFHTHRAGTVAPAQIAMQLDRHYNQLRNEVIATHIQLSDDLWVITHALQVYNGMFGIETDVDISLETMLKSWTRWKEAKMERKTMLRSENAPEGVPCFSERSIVSESDLHGCIERFLVAHRRKFLKRTRCHGINPEKVFELICHIYRLGGFTDGFTGLIFGKDESVCRKAAERFKYRLIEWLKQGIEPPTLS
jgi:hypothetical protein